MPAVAQVEADQVAEQVGVAFGEIRPVVGTKSGTMPCSIFARAASTLSSSAIWKRQARMSRSRPKGWPCGLRRGAAAEDIEALGPRLGPGFELVEQPALADAGLGDHGDDGQTAVSAEHALEGVLQRLELGVAADHAGGDAFDAAGADAKGARLGAQHEVAVDGLVDALDRERRLRLDLEQAAHLAHRCRG